ncbi:MAG: hypothetical protein ACI9OJ_005422, partial [Myxococcota bacterium]
MRFDSLRSHAGLVCVAACFCLLASGCEQTAPQAAPDHWSCDTGRGCESGRCFAAPGGSYCVASCDGSSCPNGDCVDGGCVPRCELGSCPSTLSCAPLGTRAVCVLPEAAPECDDGFSRCDEHCVHTMTSLEHCGSCGASCNDGLCHQGACTCPDDRPDHCPSQGCQSIEADTAHCGACDTPCAPPNALGRCLDGTCHIAECQAGWGDCNTDPSDGCEATLADL